MSKNNPDQLRMEFHETNSHFQELCDSLGVTVDDIDDLYNSLGSYGDAWRASGASQSQIDELYRGSAGSDEVAPDVFKARVTSVPVSVDRRAAATHLLGASKSLAEASGTEGLIHAIETDHPLVKNKYDRSDIPRFKEKVKRCTIIGKKALRNAYGDPEVLIEAGFDRRDIESDVKDNEREFIDKHIGPEPDKRKNLAKLREKQERILK